MFRDLIWNPDRRPLANPVGVSHFFVVCPGVPLLTLTVPDGWRPSNLSCWLFSGTAMCLWFTTCLPCLVRCWSSCFWWVFSSSSWDYAACRKHKKTMLRSDFWGNVCQGETAWDGMRESGYNQAHVEAKFQGMFELHLHWLCLAPGCQLSQRGICSMRLSSARSQMPKSKKMQSRKSDFSETCVVHWGALNAAVSIRWHVLVMKCTSWILSAQRMDVGVCWVYVLCVTEEMGGTLRPFEWNLESNEPWRPAGEAESWQVETVWREPSSTSNDNDTLN